MRNSQELTAGDFEDFVEIKCLSKESFINACNKTINSCYLPSKKEHYKKSFTCFGEPDDDNVPLILLNILSSNTGDGNQGRKHDLLRHLYQLPACESDSDSKRRIDREKEALISRLKIHNKDNQRYITLEISNSGKRDDWYKLYLDIRKLTAQKLRFAIQVQPENIKLKFLKKARPLDDKNALVRVLQILEHDLKLGFSILSFVFDLDFLTGDLEKFQYSFLRSFMRACTAEDIFNPQSNLHVLTREYWENLYSNLQNHCQTPEMIACLKHIQKNMHIFNSGNDKIGLFMWYPKTVIRDLNKLAKLIAHNNPHAELSSKLNHFLDLFDLKVKNLYSKQKMAISKWHSLHVSALLNGFWVLAAQIDESPFLTSKISDCSTGSIISPEFYKMNDVAKNPDITYLCYKEKKVHTPATSCGNYTYEATEEIEKYGEFCLPYYLWWTCKRADIFINPKFAEANEPTRNYYQGLPAIRFGTIEKSIAKKNYADLIYAYAARLTGSCLIADEYSEIPQAKLILSLLMDYGDLCKDPVAKACAQNTVKEYLVKAVKEKQYPLVLFIAEYKKTLSQTLSIPRELCRDEKSRDAGHHLYSEYGVQWWIALSQMAPEAPKEIKQNIFGFFNAVCENNKESEEKAVQQAPSNS